MRTKIMIISAVALIGLIGWLIDNVFGRTLRPEHQNTSIHQTWNGQVAVVMRSDPALLYW